jgi:hippurate hydrolase
MVNDVGLTRRTAAALRAALGDHQVQTKPPVMGGEDFSRYGRAGVPICMFRLGTIPTERVEEAHRGGRPLPSLHSDLFYPVPEPTIKTGTLAMTAAVLNLVGK